MRKINHSQSLITATLTILLAATSASAQPQQLKDSCTKLRSLKAPQPSFITASEVVVSLKRLLIITKNNKPTESLVTKQTAESGNYYFVMGDQNSVDVFTNKSYSLKISVKAFEHRPLSARWINAKLLFIEVSINPHRSAYWVFDVEKQQVILTELKEDGDIEWSQCQRQSP